MDIIWVGVAFLFGFAVARVHLPPLVGYLIAGLALAAYGYEPGSMLKEISHYGVIFLLFTVGLHIRLKNILRYDILGIGLTHLAISTAIFTPICLYFGYDLQAAIIISITLGFSSTVLTAKNLERRNELGALYGRAAIGILIIQDLVAIGIIAYTGGGVPSIWGLSVLALPLTRPILIKLLGIIKEDELWMLFGLALAIGGATLFEFFNLSGELGALAAGMLLAADERADEIGKKMWGIKEAFLVGFFLEIGLIGFPSMSGYYFIVAVLLILPIKSVLFFGLFMFFKFRARTGFLASVSLTAYSEFTLIAGVVASAGGFIPEETIVVLGLLTAISYAINAPITINEEKIWKKWEKYLLRLERDVRHPEHQTVSLGSAEYLIVGMGNAGRAAYDKLKEQSKPLLVWILTPTELRGIWKQAEGWYMVIYKILSFGTT